MSLSTELQSAAPEPPAWPQLSAEDRFARVVEAAPNALVLTGRDGKIEMVNHQAERMFGYGRAEIQGQPLEMLMPERFRHHHPTLRQNFLAAMSPRIMGQGRDLYGLRKDGSEFPLEIGLNPIELDGEAMVIASIVDITSRRSNELEREQQRRELERSNADLEEFAYAASHDLKAPLRGIAHLAEWIIEDVTPIANPETLENLALLQGRVLRMQALLDGLLAYSRVGHTDAPAEDVDIAELVGEVTLMLAPPPEFTVECVGAMATIRTRRSPIQMVLENLIGNGIKHHDKPHGHITVAMRRLPESDGGLYEIRVTDDGPGIAPQYHERIFQIFQTLVRRDEVESSGIGLAIVKKRIVANGGKIRVESNPPQRGTSFIFTWKAEAP